MISKISRTTSGARPSDGSSIIMSFGRAMSARPTASICCSPPESVPPACHERSRRRGKRSYTHWISPEMSSLRRYAPTLRFSRTVRSGKMCRPSGTSVMPFFTMVVASRPVMLSPRKLIVPPEGFTSPAIVRSVELLPAPFAPMSVTISPSCTSKEMPLTASMPP